MNVRYIQAIAKWGATKLIKDAVGKSYKTNFL